MQQGQHERTDDQNQSVPKWISATCILVEQPGMQLSTVIMYSLSVGLFFLSTFIFTFLELDS